MADDVKWWRRASANDLALGKRVLWIREGGGGPFEVTIRDPEEWESAFGRWATSHLSYFITQPDLDDGRIFVVMDPS